MKMISGILIVSALTHDDRYLQSIDHHSGTRGHGFRWLVGELGEGSAEMRWSLSSAFLEHRCGFCHLDTAIVRLEKYIVRFQEVICLFGP